MDVLTLMRKEGLLKLLIDTRRRYVHNGKTDSCEPVFSHTRRRYVHNGKTDSCEPVFSHVLGDTNA